ncbi:hypothetical protein QBC46DRAFT_457253 [Diplogelasinospora grovesii]|uniref:Uncharacterized protein n=1 Tax=Diplogelasinospora grovesii TaxID=303347 RepID=A0AAN6S6F7_9PEZI|nr:hypothetical protein QBC46DRAFT_457253 [Diplogelasinospora grovesii]
MKDDSFRENPDPAHLHAFRRALTNVLSTEVADFTFAQIIDGLPTCASFWEFHYLHWVDHPVQTHEAVWDGAWKKLHTMKATFDPLSLKFAPNTLQAFQEATPGSRAFHLRLIEMLAVSVHQIAAYIFDQRDDHANRNKQYYDAWVTEQQRQNAGDKESGYYTYTEPPVVFYHPCYCDYEQYPRGIFDVVGYWAEAKIFGGVLLFDRGESETECKELWIHTGKRSPRTLFPPTPDQFQRFVDFLQSEKSGSGTASSCPLPIRPTKHNRPRWFHYHASKYFHIFRDKYDSRHPEFFLWPERPSITDFPEMADHAWWTVHQLEVAMGEVQLDEAAVAAAMESMKNITISSPLSTEHAKYP